jgi:hypothetical protein
MTCVEVNARVSVVVVAGIVSFKRPDVCQIDDRWEEKAE